MNKDYQEKSFTITVPVGEVSTPKGARLIIFQVDVIRQNLIIRTRNLRTGIDAWHTYKNLDKIQIRNYAASELTNICGAAGKKLERNIGHYRQELFKYLELLVE